MNSNKRKIDESDTDDCDSKRIKREDSDCSVDGFYYTRSRAANIAQLPNEILLSIFSYLGPPELYWNVRLVCVNWYKLSMCPSLWTKIKIGPELEVSTKRLLIWLTIAGNKLKRLEMNNRMDASTVIRKVCTLLFTLRWYSCKEWVSESIVRCGTIAGSFFQKMRTIRSLTSLRNTTPASFLKVQFDKEAGNDYVVDK